MNKKESKKFRSRIVRIKHLRGKLNTVPSPDDLVERLVGKPQTVVIDSALLAGFVAEKDVVYLLVKTGACKSEKHAQKRFARHVHKDVDKRIASRKPVLA